MVTYGVWGGLLTAPLYPLIGGKFGKLVSTNKINDLGGIKYLPRALVTLVSKLDIYIKNNDLRLTMNFTSRGKFVSVSKSLINDQDFLIICSLKPATCVGAFVPKFFHGSPSYDKAIMAIIRSSSSFLKAIKFMINVHTMDPSNTFFGCTTEANSFVI